jgi:hypothetical protein
MTKRSTEGQTEGATMVPRVHNFGQAMIEKHGERVDCATPFL